MIDLNNCQLDLTSEMRRTTLQRAVYTQPYFYRISLPYDKNKKQVNARSVLGINSDFFLTEYQSNIGEAALAGNANTFFDATVYTGYDRSIYLYNSLRKIPSGLIFEEARHTDSAANTVFFVDRQQERFPFFIRRNDKVYVELTSLANASNDGIIEVILKGFNVIPNGGLTPTETDQCNKSLASDVEWQYFKFLISTAQPQVYTIENDNKPRILLGFGAQNGVQQTPLVDITITDISRRLRLTDMAIPLEFIAPKIANVQDTHIYYLPVEYYLEPYAKLQFDVKYTSIERFVPVEVSALTRTV